MYDSTGGRVAKLCGAFIGEGSIAPAATCDAHCIAKRRGRMQHEFQSIMCGRRTIKVDACFGVADDLEADAVTTLGQSRLYKTVTRCRWRSIDGTWRQDVSLTTQWITKVSSAVDALWQKILMRIFW